MVQKRLDRGTWDCTRERTRYSCAAQEVTQETEFVRAVAVRTNRPDIWTVAGRTFEASSRAVSARRTRTTSADCYPAAALPEEASSDPRAA